MIGKFLDAITGKDDLERVAYKENISSLNAYLKNRRVLIPRLPKQFLDASNYTENELLELMQKEAEEAASDQFEPWILEVEGKKRLPVFSNPKRLEAFSKKLSEQMGQIFALSSAELLLADITESVEVDYVDLNLFSEKSWEIGVRK
jgi:hypothetical protein